MPKEKISGTDMNSLCKQIGTGRVAGNDVLDLTYADRDTMEVLYVVGASYLKAATDTPIEIWRRHTFARGCARDDFVAWERRGNHAELYGDQ